MSGGLIIIARDKFGKIKQDLEISLDSEKRKIIKENSLKEKEEKEKKNE